MIDQIGYTEANTFSQVFFAAIVFVVLFAVIFLGERYQSKK